MLVEDWWIRADGAVKRMGTSEHAEEALRFLLGLPDDTRIDRKKLFTGINPREITSALKRGVPKNVVAYLSRDTMDPRTWMIQKQGWIRVARSLFNLWQFDQTTLDQIRESAYWATQAKADPNDMISVDELSTGNKFEVPVRALRYRGARAEDLKSIALSRGQFLTPEQIEVEDERYTRPYGRPGGHTDGPVDGRWQYRSFGANPDEE
jgi:hypothetical protein